MAEQAFFWYEHYMKHACVCSQAERRCCENWASHRTVLKRCNKERLSSHPGSAERRALGEKSGGMEPCLDAAEAFISAAWGWVSDSCRRLPSPWITAAVFNGAKQSIFYPKIRGNIWISGLRLFTFSITPKPHNVTHLCSLTCRYILNYNQSILDQYLIKRQINAAGVLRISPSHLPWVLGLGLRGVWGGSDPSRVVRFAVQDLLFSASVASANNNHAATSSNSRQDATQRKPRLSVHPGDGLAAWDPHHTKHFSAPLSANLWNLTSLVDTGAEDNGYGFIWTWWWWYRNNIGG